MIIHRAYLKNKAHAIYQKFDEIIYQNKLLLKNVHLHNQIYTGHSSAIYVQFRSDTMKTKLFGIQI